MAAYPIYLDYNATTPVDREAAQAMIPYLTEHFGNPSSGHAYGAAARAAVDQARVHVAALLGCDPEDLIFTSGGTESNNTVLKGVAESHSARGRHIITSAIEHPAVLEPCDWLAQRGFEISVLPVNEYGRVDPAQVEQALRPDTILVSIMTANNEVGTIQPIAKIAALAHERGALVHTDAAQAVGKLPVDVKALDVDFLSLAGHKLYAPKGIGALYVRAGVRLPKFMHGASHESNRRAGTENVPEIVGLGEAARVALRDLDSNIAHMRAMRDRLWAGLDGRLTDVRRNGHPEYALPNTLSVSFRGVNANDLLDAIGGQVAASAGAACHADLVTLSAVLEAMHVPLEYARGTLRLSVGKLTTEAEVDTAVNAIVEAVGRLRQADQ
jgi:cysteine desulfurase